jgi:hypothetical protein
VEFPEATQNFDMDKLIALKNVFDGMAVTGTPKLDTGKL